MPMRIPRHVPLGANTERARQKQQNRLRKRVHGTVAERGYGGQHRKVRAAWLLQHPMCVMCAARGVRTVATELDHIDGSARNIANSNLRSLCESCHSSHTNRTRHIKPGSR